MENSVKSPFTFAVDWRWILAGYCYLVLFHLLPTVMLGSFAFPVSPVGGIGSVKAVNVATVWLLFGVAVVAFVIGYRSRGFTILEPAISGVLYAFTTAAGFHGLLASNVREEVPMAIVFWVLIVIILTVASAWLGEIAQRRAEKSRE